MKTTYPDDCLQSAIADEWWLEDSAPSLSRGALVAAFIPYVDQTPFTFEPIGRKDATQHDKATVRVAPLKVDQPLKQTQLPVAAMPLHGNEVFCAYRAKRRPCLVVGTQSPRVDRKLTQGKPNHATSSAVLVAPFYGVDQGVKRAGYNAVFIERVRQGEYPQFLWDKLPIKSGPQESLLRLDQIQPIGTHHQAYKPLGYKLSEGALVVLDELISYQFSGGVPAAGIFAAYRELIEEML